MSSAKFFAALITFLMMWLPFGLFMLAIPLSGGAPFDYRPILSFAIALTATGAAFVSGGLFFSSLTRNQVASGVLTGVYMMFLTFTLFPRRQQPTQRRATGKGSLPAHMSYLGLWLESLDGILRLKYILFYLSMTVFFLFLSVKVLESRASGAEINEQRGANHVHHHRAQARPANPGNPRAADRCAAWRGQYPRVAAAGAASRRCHPARHQALADSPGTRSRRGGRAAARKASGPSSSGAGWSP